MDVRYTMPLASAYPAKGTEFIDRVDFPNEWKVGDEHGLIHDGLQVYAAAAATRLLQSLPTAPFRLLCLII